MAKTRKGTTKNPITTANSMLWAAAIVAAALLKAPAVLTLLLLPSLAVCALLTATHGGKTRGNAAGGTCT